MNCQVLIFNCICEVVCITDLHFEFNTLCPVLDLSFLIIIDEKLVGQFNTDFLSDFDIGNELSSINIGPSYLNCIFEMVCITYLLILNSIFYARSNFLLSFSTFYEKKSLFESTISSGIFWKVLRQS